MDQELNLLTLAKKETERTNKLKFIFASVIFSAASVFASTFYIFRSLYKHRVKSEG